MMARACVFVLERPCAAEEADINQKGHVDYKEFILMITVLFLMTDKHVDGEEATLINNAVQKVLEVGAYVVFFFF